MSSIKRELERLREFARSAPGVIDVNASVTADALENLDNRLRALEGGAPPSVTKSEVIALCAVIVDEAETFARQRIDIRDEGLDCNGVELETHARRCRALYLKLCGYTATNQNKE